MMTYRERREARAERLREWADKRDARSQAAFERVSSIADNIPLGQPILVGHHSERRARADAERIHNGMRDGIEHGRKAEEMSRKADNIERAAAVAIYSDDADAADRLAEKIARLEAERDRITAYNAACRKAGKATADAMAILDEKQRADALSLARIGFLRPTGAFPSYATSNLGGNISRLRDRLARLA